MEVLEAKAGWLSREHFVEIDLIKGKLTPNRLLLGVRRFTVAAWSRLQFFNHSLFIQTGPWRWSTHAN